MSHAQSSIEINNKKQTDTYKQVLQSKLTKLSGITLEFTHKHRTAGIVTI